MGQKYKLNYPLPKLVQIKELNQNLTQVKRIQAGKFSSYVMLKNRKIVVWGETNFDNKTGIREYNPINPDGFYQAPADYYIYDICSVWNDQVEISYFKVFDVSSCPEKQKIKVACEKIE